MDTSPLWSLDWVRAVQGWGHGLLAPMQATTFFGSPGFVVLLILLFYWCIDKRTGRDLALLMILSSYGNTLLKAITHRARPYWLDPSLGRAVENSYSFPSGHAQNAAVLLGYLAWRLIRAAESVATHRAARRLAAGGLLLLIPLVALSRVYLGVHFPGDVLLGLAAGFLTLALYLWLAPTVGRWLAARTWVVNLALALGVAALTLLSIRAALNLPSVGEAPTWRAIGHEATLTSAAALAGMIVGGWTGFMLEARRVRFRVDGPLGQRALRFGLGIAGLGVLALGIGALVPTMPITYGLQGAVATFWVTYLAPWLFVRVGLAEAE